MKKEKIIKLGIFISLTVIINIKCNIENENTSIDNTDSAIAKILDEAPGTYEITNKNEEIIIPFEYFGMNLLINGVINGKKVKLLIDNGHLWDEVWFYNGEVDSINLKYNNDENIALTGLGEDGGSNLKEGNNVDINFGDILFKDQPCFISPPEAGFGNYFPGVNGQVSSLLFKHFVVKFDFDNNVIILTKPIDFKYSGKGQAIKMTEEEEGVYSIPFFMQFANNNSVNIDLEIDLGTTSYFHLIKNKNNNISIPENLEKQLLGYGASGAIYGYHSKIALVKIGKYSLINVPIVLVEEKANEEETIVDNGTFGLSLMKRFNITFDYFNQVMYFELNNSFNDPFVNINKK